MFRTVFWSIWKFEASKLEVIRRALSVDDTLLRKLMRYKSLRPLPDPYSEKARTYWDRSIATVAITGNGGIQRMKVLYAVDAVTFCKELFHGNRNNLNPLEFLIQKHKLDAIRYLLSLEEVKRRLHRDEEVMFRAIYWMFQRFKPAVIECFETALGKEHFGKVVVSLINYKAVDPNSAKLRISSTAMDNGGGPDGDERKKDADSSKMKMAVIECQVMTESLSFFFLMFIYEEVI